MGGLGHVLMCGYVTGRGHGLRCERCGEIASGYDRSGRDWWQRRWRRVDAGYAFEGLVVSLGPVVELVGLLWWLDGVVPVAVELVSGDG